MEVSGRNQDQHMYQKENLKAWDLLQTPLKVNDPRGLRAYLHELGVFDSKDLLVCRDEWLHQMSTFLKINSQNKFNNYMGRHSHAVLGPRHHPQPQPWIRHQPAEVTCRDYNQAWELLTKNPDVLINPDGLENCLNELGVTKSSDLPHLTNECLMKIGKFIKQLPLKRFMRVLMLKPEADTIVLDTTTMLDYEGRKFINPVISRILKAFYYIYYNYI
jgi:hypothetical protein